MSTIRVARHALLRHKLARLRQRETDSAVFRRLLAEIGAILTAEALRDLPEMPRLVDTPLARTQVSSLAGPEPCLVAVLRAGLGMLDGARWVLPEAPVGHLGLLHPPGEPPREYMAALPPELAARGALLLDPMLASGATACAAVARLKAAGARSIRLACVVAAPAGAARLAKYHPDVPVLTAALDEGLSEGGLVLPGLGDAGDRCFGT